MIVAKFGGATLQDADRYSQALDTVLSYVPDRRIAVVVSAIGGKPKLTDKTIYAAIANVRNGNQDDNLITPKYRRILNGNSLNDKEKAQHEEYLVFVDGLADISPENLASVIAQQNYRMAEEIGADSRTYDGIKKVEVELRAGLERMDNLDEKTLDTILSIPERMNSEVYAGALRAMGYNAKALYAAEIGFVTNANFGNAILFEGIAYYKIAQHLNKFYKKYGNNAIPVITGFEGITFGGDRTTLGRDGSDISATILGAAIHTYAGKLKHLEPVEEVVIVTNTEGILRADPDIIGDEVLLDNVVSLSYDETDELAEYGAKVIHPSAMTPVRKLGVPVRVIKGFDRKTEGTLITSDPIVESGIIKAIAYQRDITAINVWVHSTKLNQPTVLRDVSNVFSNAGVSVDHISSSIKVITYTTTDSDKVDGLVEMLRGQRDIIRDVDVYKGRASITLVGHGLGPSFGILHRASEALANEEISIRCVLQPSDYVMLTFFVEKNDLERSVKALYRAFKNERGNKNAGSN